jgi:hypothetical protein
MMESMSKLQMMGGGMGGGMGGMGGMMWYLSLPIV